jgi:hypothetical protein
MFEGGVAAAQQEWARRWWCWQIVIADAMAARFLAGKTQSGFGRQRYRTALTCRTVSSKNESTPERHFACHGSTAETKILAPRKTPLRRRYHATVEAFSPAQRRDFGLKVTNTEKSKPAKYYCPVLTWWCRRAA